MGSTASWPTRRRPRASSGSRTGCRSPRRARPTTTRDESPSGTGPQRVVVRVDAHDAHVVEDVPADDLRRHPVAVDELDVEAAGAVRVGVALAGGRDHVRVREDHAVVGDDEPGALGARGRVVPGEAEDGVDRDDARHRAWRRSQQGRSDCRATAARPPGARLRPARGRRSSERTACRRRPPRRRSRCRSRAQPSLRATAATTATTATAPGRTVSL